MPTISFLYQDKEYPIQYNQNEILAVIIQKFCEEISLKRESLIFLYNGKILNENITENEILFNQNDKKIILVKDNLPINKNLDVIIKSKNIICPECCESASISMENYIISVSNCKNGHTIDNISIEEFENTQNINISKIICNICNKNNKGNVNNHTFFRCITCKKNICPECKTLHEREHNIINYENIFYFCDSHGKEFISFCFDCKKNLCLECEESHKIHKQKYFKELMEKNKENIKNELQIMNDKINLMKSKINEIINICTTVKNNYEIIFRIKKTIYENTNKNYTNYQEIMNQKFINNDFLQDLNLLINENKTMSIFENILNLKEKMVKSEELKNYIIIKYKIKEKDKNIKIFGKDFVENNYDKCKILFNKKEYELSKNIDINSLKNINNDIFEIKLSGINNITNAYSMFSGCSSLISLPNISIWNTSKVTRIDSMFYGCSSLAFLSDISIWDISNVNRIDFMFFGCSSLISLPDISKWNISKVTLIYSMFYGCSKLESLPDISKWDTSKITDMNFTFFGCSSLSSLPDISKWNTLRVTDMNSIFSCCKSLSSLPDISKWNT